jgi:O-antigen/teichoic acid export membrane protein
VVKFVAKYIARQDDKSVSDVIQTASFSVAAFTGLVLLIAYPFVGWVLGLVVPEESLPLALAVLPYALLALWLMIITSIFQSGLDGCQRIDLRSTILMGGAIFHLLLCFMLAPSFGLIGVACARVIQNITMLLISWFLLRRYLPALPLFPCRWNKAIFKEIIGYGINFQVISIATMFYDPITKALLSKFGGLSMVGYYEMASRMVQQFRALIISANQVLVPAIADLKEKTPEKIHSVYLTSYQLLFYLSLPLYCLIIIGIPLISQLWIGHYEETFVFFGIILSIGWFLNTLAGPSYFAYLGIGELRWNVIGHVTIGILNAGLGFLLGAFYGGIGVVVAWVVSLALGSSQIYLSYHIKNEIPLIELLPRASRIIIVACLISILFSITAQYKLNHVLNPMLLNSAVFFMFSIIIFLPLWLHPMRKRLMGWVSQYLVKSEKVM